jgi:hypothetical protein
MLERNTSALIAFYREWIDLAAIAHRVCAGAIRFCTVDLKSEKPRWMPETHAATASPSDRNGACSLPQEQQERGNERRAGHCLNP